MVGGVRQSFSYKFFDGDGIFIASSGIGAEVFQDFRTVFFVVDGFEKEGLRLGFVLWCAFALEVAFAEGELGVGIALVGGFGEVAESFVFVFRHSFAFFVATAKLVLCFVVALCGGFGVPLEGFQVVFGRAVPFVVAATEAVLCFLVTFLCGWQEFLDGEFVLLLVVELLALVVEGFGTLGFCHDACEEHQHEEDRFCHGVGFVYDRFLLQMYNIILRGQKSGGCLCVGDEKVVPLQPIWRGERERRARAER